MNGAHFNILLSHYQLCSVPSSQHIQIMQRIDISTSYGDILHSGHLSKTKNSVVTWINGFQLGDHMDHLLAPWTLLWGPLYEGHYICSTIGTPRCKVHIIITHHHPPPHPTPHPHPHPTPTHPNHHTPQPPHTHIWEQMGKCNLAKCILSTHEPPFLDSQTTQIYVYGFLIALTFGTRIGNCQSTRHIMKQYVHVNIKSPGLFDIQRDLTLRHLIWYFMIWHILMPHNMMIYYF